MQKTRRQTKRPTASSISCVPCMGNNKRMQVPTCQVQRQEELLVRDKDAIHEGKSEGYCGRAITTVKACTEKHDLHTEASPDSG